MRYLTLGEVVELHRLVLTVTGGASGIRDLGVLASAVAQPRATFGGSDMYPSLIEKAGALGFALVQSHPFVDGNKRVAHAAMATFLLLNGADIDATVDEQEQLMLDLASSRVTRIQLVDWLRQHVVTRPPDQAV
jgi:death on curing protein